MALFKFKKNKKEEKKKEKKKEVQKEIKEEKISAQGGSVSGREEPIKKVVSKKTNIASFILHSPHIAEKSTLLMEQNIYVFKVLVGANKTEIKKAIKEVYGVDVIKVNIINVPRKKRVIGKSKGWRSGYRKALVKIKKGQKIELLPR